MKEQEYIEIMLTVDDNERIKILGDKNIHKEKKSSIQKLYKSV